MTLIDEWSGFKKISNNGRWDLREKKHACSLHPVVDANILYFGAFPQSCSVWQSGFLICIGCALVKTGLL